MDFADWERPSSWSARMIKDKTSSYWTMTILISSVLLLLTTPVLTKPIPFNRMESFNMGYRTAVYRIDENTTVNSYYDHVNFFMSYDTNKDKSRELSFFPDLNSQTTIVNELPNWGIPCPNTSIPEALDPSSSCTLESNTTSTFQYRQQDYHYKPAQTYFLLWDSKIDTPPIKNSLSFKLGQELNTPNWTLDNTGVLGLSPSDSNPIWNYLFKAYTFKSNRFSFSLKYMVGDPKEKFREMSSQALDGSKLLISDSSLDMPGGTTFYPIQKTLNNEPVWHLPEVTVSLLLSDGTEYPILNGKKACLTNNYHSMLAASPDIGVKFIKKVAQEMCKRDDCGSEMNLHAAPKLSISINLFDGDSAKYIISPEDYILPHKSHTNVSFSNITDWQPMTCPQDYELAFGKLFFQTSYIVFEVYKNGDKKIKLSEHIKIPKATSPEKAAMLLFILFCVFIMTSVAVYKVCKHRQEQVYDSPHSLPIEATLYRSMAGSNSDKQEE